MDKISIWHWGALIFVLLFYYLFCRLVVFLNKNRTYSVSRLAYGMKSISYLIIFYAYNLVIVSFFEKNVPNALMIFVGMLCVYYFLITNSMSRMIDAGIPISKAHYLGIPIFSKIYMIYLLFKK